MPSIDELIEQKRAQQNSDLNPAGPGFPNSVLPVSPESTSDLPPIPGVSKPDKPQPKELVGSATGRVSKKILDSVEELYSGNFGFEPDVQNMLLEAVGIGEKDTDHILLKPIRVAGKIVVGDLASAADAALKILGTPFVAGVTAVRETAKEMGMVDADANALARDVENALLLLAGGRNPNQDLRARLRRVLRDYDRKAAAGNLTNAQQEQLIDTTAKAITIGDEIVYNRTRPKEGTVDRGALIDPNIQVGRGQPQGVGIPSDELRQALLFATKEDAFSEKISAQMFAASERLLAEGEIFFDVNRPITVQVAELMETDRLTDGLFARILSEHNISSKQFFDEMLGAFQSDLSRAGRVLERASRIRKRQNRMYPPISGGAGADVYNRAGNWFDRLQRGPRTLVNIWRGLLVSQPATASRNFSSQQARIGMDTLTRGMDVGLNRIFNSTGEKAADPLVDMTDLLNVWSGMVIPLTPRNSKLAKRGKRIREDIDKLFFEGSQLKGKDNKKLKSMFVKFHDKLFLSFNSDVTRSARKREGILGQVDRGVEFVNILNRFQEITTRRGVFHAALDRRLHKDGKSLDDILERNVLDELPQDILKGAVDDAMKVTFAESFSPYSIPGKLIDLVNSFPFGGFLVPFPRFMMNSIKYQFEFSPFSILRFATPEGRALIREGNFKALSETIVGTAMFYAAYQLRASDMAGPKWYQLQIGPEPGDKLDLRPFNPMVSSLFWADLAHRYLVDKGVVESKNGGLSNVTSDDVMQAITSMTLRGTGSYVLDKALQGVSDEQDADRFLRAIKSGVGEIGAGYLTTLNFVRDMVSAFEEKAAVVRDTGQDPLLNPTIDKVTVGLSNLPGARLPTQAEPIKRKYPFLRQTFGLSFAETSPEQDELARHGFRGAEIYRKTEIPEWDRAVIAEMGPLFEQRMPIVIGSKAYTEAPRVQQALIIRQQLQQIRGVAGNRARRKHPDIWRYMQFMTRPKRERKAIREIAEDAGLQLPVKPSATVNY